LAFLNDELARLHHIARGGEHDAISSLRL
jgi:hypothetical protein